KAFPPVTIAACDCRNFVSPGKGGEMEVGKIMNWQSRLEKTVIALNLIGLALGFSTLGILILAKGELAGGSLISGILGVVVGSLFLLFAFYFCKQPGGGRGRNAGSALKDDPKKSELSSLKKVTI